MKKVVGLIFHAPMGESSIERWVEAGRRASLIDLAGRLRSAGLPIVVVSPGAIEWPSGEPPPAVYRSGSDETFHFGRALQRAVADSGAEGLLYFGSGAGALLTEAEVARLADFARGDTAGALFNNFYSCDFCALARAPEVLRTALPEVDNALGFALADAGVPCFSLERSASTQFDIDTPIDLVLLARRGVEAPALAAFCAASDVVHPSLDRALAALTDRSAVSCFVGRLSPVTWSHVESRVACRTSALVEGRGLRAGASPHVPWTRQALEAEGSRSFFDRLRRACDAAWIDTRPLLGAADSWPSAKTRFSSDLYQLDDVADPAWRDFCAAALEAPIPIVLGGHNLVSGGLYVAAEACWKGRNLLRRLHPEPFAWTKEPL